MCCNCKFTQNKSILIAKIAPACVREIPKLSLPDRRLFISACNTVKVPDALTLTSESVNLSGHTLCHANSIILYMILLASVYI